MSTAHRRVGEAGQMPFRLATIRSGCRSGSSVTTGSYRAGQRDALNKCGRPGVSSARDDVTSVDISMLNTDPRMWGLSGAEGAIRTLRALRLCRSSRPRLERGGRRTTASHQSRCRKLLAASDGSSRKPQLTRRYAVSYPDHDGRACGERPCELGHCRLADRGKLPEEIVEFTTVRPATVTAVTATYPSPRANRTRTLDHIPRNAW